MSNKKKITAKPQETVAIAWCDNGMVDGKFMEGVVDTMLHSGVQFKTAVRTAGNQIAHQRDILIEYWYEKNASDWLLWVDSDVVVTPEKFLRLWNKRDAKDVPLLTGVYFTTDQNEQPLMAPMPTVYDFAETEDGVGIKRLHPLPKDKFLKVGAAGMGFVLMHRSVVTRIREVLPNVPLFAEVGQKKTFTGEDIYFFAVCNKADVPLWCDTGATVPHMKRFSFDEHYYNAFTRREG